MTYDCVMEVELDNLVTPLELKAASSTDVTLTQVRHFIQNGWPRHQPAGLETYFRLRDELSVFDDVCVSRGIRAVIPMSLQQQVLHMAQRVIQGSYELSSDVAVPYGGLIATSKLFSETVKVVQCANSL